MALSRATETLAFVDVVGDEDAHALSADLLEDAAPYHADDLVEHLDAVDGTIAGAAGLRPRTEPPAHRRMAGRRSPAGLRSTRWFDECYGPTELWLATKRRSAECVVPTLLVALDRRVLPSTTPNVTTGNRPPF